MSKKNKKIEQASIAGSVDVMDNKIYYPNQFVSNGVVYTRFQPIGFDHSIQTLMTKLLHQLVMRYSDKTMAEMGYMHQIAILFIDGAVRVRMYFHPDLATYEEVAANGKSVQKPIPQLGIMNGYFFILTGDSINLSAVTGIEQIMAPKCKIVFNERGNKSIKIKDDSTMKLQDMFYVECNLLLTVAACMDQKLTDPEFKVSISTVSQADKKRAILVDGRNNSYQIWITVTHSNDPDVCFGYSTEDVIPYLTGLAARMTDARKAQKKLMRDAADKSEKEKKSENKKLSKYL